jgi:hypothetical protein
LPVEPRKVRPPKDVKQTPALAPVRELPPPLAPVSTSPSTVDPIKIQNAIEKGVRFLKKQQTPSGSWMYGTGTHSVGHAALPGLALLECQVEPEDPVVQKAAHFVRTHSPSLAETYDLGVAILFLDRLGEARDRGLIQRLALRLIAGQNAAGGWDYQCPVLGTSESQQFLVFLQKTRPRIDLFNPIAGGPRLANPIQSDKEPRAADPVLAEQSSNRAQVEAADPKGADAPSRAFAGPCPRPRSHCLSEEQGSG